MSIVKTTHLLRSYCIQLVHNKCKMMSAGAHRKAATYSTRKRWAEGSSSLRRGPDDLAANLEIHVETVAYDSQRHGSLGRPKEKVVHGRWLKIENADAVDEEEVVCVMQLHEDRPA
jgi:hypothetical protein